MSRHTCSPAGIRVCSGAENGWTRLQKFLVENLCGIQNRELSNDSGIHLYSSGKWWLAFNRSAYRLNRIFPDIAAVLLDTDGEGTVMLAVAESVVTELKRANEYRNITPSHIFFPMLFPDSGGYRLWLRSIASELAGGQL